MTADLKVGIGNLDSVLELQKKMDAVEYERFIYIHVGCSGYKNDGKVATCATHNVKSAEAPKGYISK